MSADHEIGLSLQREWTRAPGETSGRVWLFIYRQLSGSTNQRPRLLLIATTCTREDAGRITAAQQSTEPTLRHHYHHSLRSCQGTSVVIVSVNKSEVRLRQDMDMDISQPLILIL